MGKRLYPRGKPCKCGCGQPAEKSYKNGRFRGYCGYAVGHWIARMKTEAGRKSQARLMRRNWADPTVRSHRLASMKRREGKPNWKPPGSRRLSAFSHGSTSYWRIKTEDGKWMLEHRSVMESLIHRKLSSAEHVHHVNGDGLDNRPENLVLLPASEHHRITLKNCLHKCPLCGALHPAKNSRKESPDI